MNTVCFEVISSSIKDTFNVASFLAKSIQPPCLIGLTGKLGSGKTTFVKEYVHTLDKHNALVQSPTFTLINVYQIKDILIAHMDLYRLKSISEIDNLGIEDYFKEGVTFIEWIDQYASEFERLNYIEIKFEVLELEKRKLSFNKHVGAYRSDSFERSWDALWRLSIQP